MNDMDPGRVILAGLEPMFEEAERTGKWFHCGYQDLWFSPKQLRAEHAKGSFIWGAVNWRLRDPQELVAEAQARVESAERELQRVRHEVEHA